MTKKTKNNKGWRECGQKFMSFSPIILSTWRKVKLHVIFDWKNNNGNTKYLRRRTSDAL